MSDSDCYYNYDFCQFCCHESLGEYDTDCQNCNQTMCIRRYQAKSRAEALKEAQAQASFYLLLKDDHERQQLLIKHLKKQNAHHMKSYYKMSFLSCENKKLKEKIDELEDQVTTLQYQNDMEKQCHEREFDDLQSDAEDLRTEVQDLKEELSTVEKDYAELKERADTEEQDYSDDLDALRSEHEEQLERKDAYIKSLEEELEKLRA